MRSAILDPVRLLAATASRWLPLVAVFSMIGAVPEVYIRANAADLFHNLDGGSFVDLDLAMAALGVLLVVLLGKLLVELVALMFAFVILADVTAGRPSDLVAGIRRLASWRLQVSWLVSGMFEQAAISTWFIGGALLLVPFGFATTAAYEEGSGLAALGRSVHLGVGVPGDRPGLRVAVPVTLGFLASAAIQSMITFASCTLSPATAEPNPAAILSGKFDLASLLPPFGPIDAVMMFALAPLTMLPTVYMITVQQMGYWAARRAEEPMVPFAASQEPPCAAVSRRSPSSP